MPAKKKRSITKTYTLQSFMKALTRLKVSDDTVEDFIRELDELAAAVTRRCEKVAREDRMKTLMPQHLQKALDEVLRRGALTVEELLEKIEPLTAVELSQLADAIKKRAEDLLKLKRRARRAR